MNPKKLRDIQRTSHLIAAAIVAAYIYTPPQRQPRKRDHGQGDGPPDPDWVRPADVAGPTASPMAKSAWCRAADEIVERGCRLLNTGEWGGEQARTLWRMRKRYRSAASVGGECRTSHFQFRRAKTVRDVPVLAGPIARHAEVEAYPRHRRAFCFRRMRASPRQSRARPLRTTRDRFTAGPAHARSRKRLRERDWQRRRRSELVRTGCAPWRRSSRNPRKHA